MLVNLIALHLHLYTPYNYKILSKQHVSQLMLVHIWAGASASVGPALVSFPMLCDELQSKVTGMFPAYCLSILNITSVACFI